jgi:ATP-dependent exoDNAse (exonuclease V) beta subunit
MPFAEEDYSRKPKDKLWLDGEEMDFGLPKLVDNSSAVEGFGESKISYMKKKQEELLDNVNVLYVALTRNNCMSFQINLSEKRRSAKIICVLFLSII